MAIENKKFDCFSLIFCRKFDLNVIFFILAVALFFRKYMVCLIVWRSFILWFQLSYFKDDLCWAKSTALNVMEAFPCLFQAVCPARLRAKLLWVVDPPLFVYINIENFQVRQVCETLDDSIMVVSIIEIISWLFLLDTLGQE